MDKKKLIGTIIGVTMFAALIAGATFAWLTFSASIVNGTYNAGGRNFVIDYADGNGSITGVQILTVTTGAQVASDVANKVTLTAKLNNANSPKGELKLTLHTTSDPGGLITSNAGTTALRYSVAMCTDTTAGTACTPGTPGTPQTVTSTAQILTLPEDTTPTTTTIASNTLYTRLVVYIWIDAEKLTQTMYDNMIGQSFSAYIHADATQIES